MLCMPLCTYHAECTKIKYAHTFSMELLKYMYSNSVSKFVSYNIIVRIKCNCSIQSTAMIICTDRHNTMSCLNTVSKILSTYPSIDTEDMEHQNNNKKND